MNADVRFPTLYEFVDQIILPYYGTSAARASQVNWSPTWWKHPEVIARLESLWLRYESLLIEEPATAMETFLRVHADYHMRHLMGETSVLQDCRREDTPTIPLANAPIDTTITGEHHAH